MLDKIFDELTASIEVRENLFTLRQLLRDDRSHELLSEIDEDRKDVLLDKLSDPDAKARRNAALVIGELKDNSLVSELIYSYKHEEKLFVRADYLAAISRLDYRPYLGDFKERLSRIEHMQISGEDRKHLAIEAKWLRKLIFRHEPPVRHEFDGFSKEVDIALVVSPSLEKLTLQQLPKGSCSAVKAARGVIFLHTKRLADIMKIRTVKGYLFRFCSNPLKQDAPPEIGEEMMRAGLARYVSAMLKGKAPYYFRIDMRTNMAMGDRSKFTSRLAARIEDESGFLLVNSPTDYEFTIRLIDNGKGVFSAYLEMNTLPDRRFLYRKYTLATSTHPVKAAEMMEAASPWLSANASVLDPFCGTGVLLIERDRKLRTANLYGVDRYGEAIRMAGKNATLAGRDIFLICRDCLEFTHKYRFDEIVTEVPAVSDRMPFDMLEELLASFTYRLPVWLKEGGIACICTSEPDMFRNCLARAGGLTVLLEMELSGNRRDTLFVLRNE